MGGISVLLAGQFRQTLPVVPRGTRANELKSCIKSFFLWCKIQKMPLTKNMRVHLLGDETGCDLLTIKDGDYPTPGGEIKLSSSLGTVVGTL